MKNLFYRLFDTQASADKSLEVTVLMKSVFYAALFCLLFILIALVFSFSFTTWLPLAPLGAILFSLFLALRFFPALHRHYRIIALFILITIQAGLIYLWPLNLGSRGGTLYIFFAIFIFEVILFQSWWKGILLVVSLSVLVALLVYEYMHPEWIALQGEPDFGITDTITSILLTFILLILLTNSMKAGYNRVIQEMQNSRAAFEEDLILARNLQKQVREIDLDSIPDYDLVYRIRPSTTIGGDSFHFCRPQESVLRVMLADAQGHGVNAALSSMIIKGEWDRAAAHYQDPVELLNHLNHKIALDYDERVSFSIALADFHPRQLVYTAAGHPVQFLFNNKRLIELENSGPPAGMFRNYQYKSHHFDLNQDARLFFFTDALTEEIDQIGKNGAEWLRQVLSKCITASNQDCMLSILNSLAKILTQNPEDLRLKDDLLIMVLSHRHGALPV
ncbi:MAG: SpoIIE family protein phosphatase [Leptospiraceae bacterium]|nr:SpoIIE family protein phosphatase [Leptospiraceae bacterium]